MSDFNAVGQLVFSNTSKLNKALDAFQGSAYTEFYSADSWEPIGNSAFISMSSELPADCAGGVDSFRLIAAMATGGRVDVQYEDQRLRFLPGGNHTRLDSEAAARVVVTGGLRFAPRKRTGALKAFERGARVAWFHTPDGAAEDRAVEVRLSAGLFKLSGTQKAALHIETQLPPSLVPELQAHLDALVARAEESSLQLHYSEDAAGLEGASTVALVPAETPWVPTKPASKRSAKPKRDTVYKAEKALLGGIIWGDQVVAWSVDDMFKGPLSAPGALEKIQVPNAGGYMRGFCNISDVITVDEWLMMRSESSAVIAVFDRQLNHHRQELAELNAPASRLAANTDPDFLTYGRSSKVIQGFGAGGVHHIRFGYYDAYRLEPSSGELLTVYKGTEDFNRQATVIGELLLTRGSDVRAYDLLSGELRWTHTGNVNGDVAETPEGHVAVVEYERCVIYSADGDVVETTALDYPSGISYPAPGLMMVHRRDGFLLFDADGVLLHTHTPHRYVTSLLSHAGHWLTWSSEVSEYGGRTFDPMLYGVRQDGYATWKVELGDAVAGVVGLPHGRIAAWTADRQGGKLVTILDVKTGARVDELKHGQQVTSAMPTEDGRLLTTSKDKKVRLWTLLPASLSAKAS